MIKLKTDEEIELLAKGGKILSLVLDELESAVAVGVTGKELDEIAIARMKKENVIPAFLNYGTPPFPGALCVSTNEQVVHGLPDEYAFVDGDIVGIDAGLVYEGMYVDSARTVGVGNVSSENMRLIDVAKEALARGIASATVGNTIGHISEAVQS